MKNELAMPRLGLRSVLLVLLATLGAVTSVAACDSGTSPGAHSSVTGRPATGPSATASRPTPDGFPSSSGRAEDEAHTILESVTTESDLGGGWGLLRPLFSNTLAGTPKGVLSVSFAFVCTGDAEVAIKVGPDALRFRSLRPRVVPCDGSVVQQSVDLPHPGPVSFQGEITGDQKNGSFAYAYYPEKTHS
jgi:hypothetical protein